jgi:hypothetical protein
MTRTAPEVCPTCGAAAVPVLFGKPTEEARAAAEVGKLRLAGCIFSADGTDPQWWCVADDSHWWTSGDPDDRHWLAAISRAIG